MFRILDEAITPRKSSFETAVNRLHDSHRVAAHKATLHLHAHVSRAAEEAGLDPEPIKVFHDQGRPYVGIAHGEAGDKVADVEFGTPEEAPNPVLRHAHSAHQPGANAIYARHLWAGIGL